MEKWIKAYLHLLSSVALLILSGCGGGSAGTSPPSAVHNEWAWMGGSSTTDQPANYGTLGVPSASNSPGARGWPCSWTDSSGNFWLFGGYGEATTSIPQGYLNDLWEYSNGKWTWMGGSNQTAQPGVYGTMGASASANVPGGRWYSTCWTDPHGNFWLYGGVGVDSQGTTGNLGDLWKYSNGEWAWMAGSEIAATFQTDSTWQGLPVYGTEGVASASNTPGARRLSSGWTDPKGNLWLFGGISVIPSSNAGYGEPASLNDLWEYSNGMWRWMAGTPNSENPYGTYGVSGVPASGNTPGARSGAAAWTDAAGNLWLFGGNGNGTSAAACAGASFCVMNDFWEFSPSLNEWAWMGGPDRANQPGVFGTEGVAASGNIPPPRNSAVTWTDPSGNFWLFGGIGSPYDLNDLWKYGNGEWTWMGGANQECGAGVYGMLGTPSAASVPSARDSAIGWTDKSGNLWLFGGDILCSKYNSTTKLSDLWEYQP
jgi:hypothetical protein